MQAALDILCAEIAAVDARRTSLVTAIEAIKPLVSTSLHVVVVDEAHRHAPGVPATPIIHDEMHDYAPPVDPVGAERLGRLLAAEKRAKVGLKDDEQRILETLRQQGPLSMQALVDALGLPRDRVRYRLYEMKKRGIIGADGPTRSRVFFVPGVKVRPRKNGEDLEPVWDGSTKRSPAEVLQARREAQS